MANNTNAIEVKVNMCTLMSLVLHSADLVAIARGLHARVQQAPHFFLHTPVVVDFSRLSVDATFNYKALFKVIRQQQLLPVAVRGLPEDMREQLQAAGVPIIEQNSTQDRSDNVQMVEPDEIRGTPGRTLLIDRPLRAGQSCYAPDADLIVLGDTLADNELVADGSIHIYGVLRGRAVCGLQGDTQARIYCTGLQAESVSVAGVSLQPVVVPDELSNASTLQVLLNGDLPVIQSCGSVS